MKEHDSMADELSRCEYICKTYKHTFRGIVGEYVGNATKVDVMCNTCEHPITTLTIGKLLFGGKVRCSICTQNKSKTVKAKKAKELHHSKQCEERCRELGLNFLGWKGLYSGVMTIIDARCELCGSDVTTRTSITNLMNKRKYGCTKCVPKVDEHNKLTQTTGNHGFVPARCGDDDNLYLVEIVMPDGNRMIKVGRAFNVRDRLRRIEKDSGGKVVIMRTIKNTHHNIFLIETEIKMKLYHYRHGKEYNFSGYYSECYKECILTMSIINEVFYKDAAQNNE